MASVTPWAARSAGTFTVGAGAAARYEWLVELVVGYEETWFAVTRYRFGVKKRALVGQQVTSVIEGVAVL